MDSSRKVLAKLLEESDRLHNFVYRHESVCVIRNINVRRCVHLDVRIVCCRVSYHRDFVAKLKRKTNRCFHTRVCDQPYDDELMVAMLLELQIQIRICKATGTPMLEDHSFTGLRVELVTDHTSPRAVSERLARPRSLLNGRNVLPRFVVPGTVVPF
jgi:hypothetical protein